MGACCAEREHVSKTENKQDKKQQDNKTNEKDKISKDQSPDTDKQENKTPDTKVTEIEYEQVEQPAAEKKQTKLILKKGHVKFTKTQEMNLKSILEEIKEKDDEKDSLQPENTPVIQNEEQEKNTVQAEIPVAEDREDRDVCRFTESSQQSNVDRSMISEDWTGLQWEKKQPMFLEEEFKSPPFTQKTINRGALVTSSEIQLTSIGDFRDVTQMTFIPTRKELEGLSLEALSEWRLGAIYYTPAESIQKLTFEFINGSVSPLKGSYGDSLDKNWKRQVVPNEQIWEIKFGIYEHEKQETEDQQQSLHLIQFKGGKSKESSLLLAMADSDATNLKTEKVRLTESQKIVGVKVNVAQGLHPESVTFLMHDSKQRKLFA